MRAHELVQGSGFDLVLVCSAPPRLTGSNAGFLAHEVLALCEDAFGLRRAKGRRLAGACWVARHLVIQRAGFGVQRAVFGRPSRRKVGV